MKIVIEINTENEAFVHTCSIPACTIQYNTYEIERVLAAAKRKLWDHDGCDEEWTEPLFDSNGNRCGEIRATWG